MIKITWNGVGERKRLDRKKWTWVKFNMMRTLHDNEYCEIICKGCHKALKLWNLFVLFNTQIFTFQKQKPRALGQREPS